MTEYIMKRKLRHIRSIGIYNVRMPLINGTTTNLVKTNTCFFTIETIKQDTLYVSENQQNTSSTVQFNEVNFNGCPLNHFVLKIFTDYPLEEPLALNSSDKIEKWNQVALFSIDLNNLTVIDIDKLSSIQDINIPIFKMSDGCFIPKQFNFNVENPINQFGNYDRGKLKSSFNYNSLIKLNKLIEYQKQINHDKIDISKRIESYLDECNFKESNKERLKIIDISISKIKVRLSEKKLKVKKLKSKLKISEDESQNFLPFNKQNSNITIEQDEYGNAYSNLIQLKDKIGKIQSKKIQKLITIFNDIPFMDNKEIEFFQMTLNESSSNTVYGCKLQLFNVDFDHILKLSQESEAKRIKTNTQLGSYVLLLLIISKKIMNMRIPFNMAYYGSTSMIDFQYPLFLTNVQSIKNINEFKVGIKLLNMNINQINQFLQI